MTDADAQINHQGARDYWQSIDADVNGMLGGLEEQYNFIPRVDIQGSKNFLAKLGIGGKSKKKLERAVDCGAGIGRITENLLLNVAETVDIVEPIAKFTDKLKDKDGIGNIFNVGLEDWLPNEIASGGSGYDLIWNQWCLGHLTDAQLLFYLEHCGKVLKEGGWIIVKENTIKTGGEDIFDDLDSSVTRTDKKFRDIFKKAGMQLRKTELQKGMPSELYPVRTYALQPEPSH